MSYDEVGKVWREEYSWGNDSNFNTTAVTHQIVGPKGCVGFVRDISIDITTAITGGSTTVPEIQVGISSGDTTFGRYRLGTAAGTPYTGTGIHRAGLEFITGPGGATGRQATDFTGHVQLDGGPTTTAGVAGGSFGTQVPSGRIPPSGYTVINDVSGTAGVVRLFLKEAIDTLLKVGQLVNVHGVQGATPATITAAAISVINTAANYIELTGTTFGGTYTGGGIVEIVTTVTLAPGNATGAGGGYVRVIIDWLGNPWT